MREMIEKASRERERERKREIAMRRMMKESWLMIFTREI